MQNGVPSTRPVTRQARPSRTSRASVVLLALAALGAQDDAQAEAAWPGGARATRFCGVAFPALHDDMTGTSRAATIRSRIALRGRSVAGNVSPVLGVRG